MFLYYIRDQWYKQDTNYIIAVRAAYMSSQMIEIKDDGSGVFKCRTAPFKDDGSGVFKCRTAPSYPITKEDVLLYILQTKELPAEYYA